MINLSIKAIAGLVLLTAVVSSCAGSNTQESAPVAVNTVEAKPTQEILPTESKEPVRLEGNGEVPFYARFGENETFSDGEWTVIIFYRPPECIPADFNLNQFFHFPNEGNPGAFACSPPTMTSIEYWTNGPDTDPAPLSAEMMGRGAVPVWFVAEADMVQAMEDGVVTIQELTAVPSRLVGEAETYTELLHPSQTNVKALIQFKAEGTLEDGRSFTVDVSYGAPDVNNHTTIEIQ
ncbi:MAG: hypothetical protein DCC56_00565 [Anaerolineae bacterium]|nr:MAG: hypothetical protein DCC56_00565 [Anaerolineae bacterium]WKZ44526.1 MAG: hypothetical protein QY302_01895 [Anaerolineales bacterium]